MTSRSLSARVPVFEGAAAAECDGPAAAAYEEAAAADEQAAAADDGGTLGSAVGAISRCG